MDFVLLLLINLAILALMYLALRHQITRNYNSENFIDRLQKEVNGVITDLNQTTEMNVQIISHESEKLKKLEKKVEERIAEMQQIYTLLDSRDSRYQEILNNARRVQKTSGHPADPSKAYRKAAAPLQHGDPGATSIQSQLTSPGIHERHLHKTDIHETQVNMTEPSPETQADAPVQRPEHAEGDSDNDSLTPREKVLGYYHQGRELDDIAARTGLPLGEVELIIELHK